MQLTLSPLMATGIFMLACWSGYQYRRVWKMHGAHWKLWTYGLLAAGCLLTVGFVPLSVGS
ncbi:MAG: hypothetical protein AAGC83_09525 [Pseudomonadota bacterium]